MDIFLDIQGFGRFSEKFVVKELATMSVKKPPADRESSLARVLFKSPCSWVTLSREYRNLNTWLTQNYHGIPWTAGDTPYKDVGKVVNEIVKDATYIFVMGKEKKEWVKKIINDGSRKAVIDLKELGCPTIRELRRDFNTIRWHGDCHGSVIDYKCAFENVQRLKNWFLLRCHANCFRSQRILEQAGLELMCAADIFFLDRYFIHYYGSNIIDELWDKLSVEQKNNEKLANCRKCKLHYDKSYALPIPMIAQCPYCKSPENKQ